jgi:hypothetical protein
MTVTVEEYLLVHEGKDAVVRVPFSDACVLMPQRVESLRNAYSTAVMHSQMGLIEDTHTHISEMIKYARSLDLETFVIDVAKSIMFQGLETHMRSPNPNMEIAAAYAREYRLA